VASRGRSQQRRSGDRRWFKRGRRKYCAFCADKSLQIDYKLVDMLRGFLTDRGKIQPRRRSGTCAKHQRQLSTAIKRARHLAMLPFVVEADRR
jgi:small subunit ribosomal protein S18